MDENAKKHDRQKISSAYKELREAYRKLENSQIEMIFRLALLTELRDPSTGTHLVRIADYSAIIAEGMTLPKEDVQLVRLASPMHDIGKIILPDSILKKKGKLTEKEMALMRKHPEVGAEVFKNAKSEIMQACKLIAYTHHEHFDGSGYPQGLKGEDIPVYGRIVALADCFDALTSKRSYKDAYSFDKSVSIVSEEAGTHFDPAVVISFIRNKEKIKKIWESNRDIEVFLENMGIVEDTFLF
ncbi:MAG: HD domain-containing phosphohydrolase [Candidatus Omnitrophota bacterium]|nr:HD domain-containing protein [Candidatus Omnitrophota bacterium]MBU1894535.1 HD domain-containing protein [Candidatus Omnitrophota bacterium]